MYKDEIKELYELKKDSKKIVVKELLSLYLEFKFKNKDVFIIKQLIKFYLNYDKEEKEILKEINKRFGNVDYNSTIEDILNELDEIYNYYYSFIDDYINNNCITNKLEIKLNKDKILTRIRSI